MPDYKLHDPKGWCGDPKRGAALGRPTIKGPADYSGKLCLRRIRLSGDYDCNGTYFGFVPGSYLYWYADEDGEIDGMLRAPNRDSARAQVLKLYPEAKVRR